MGAKRAAKRWTWVDINVTDRFTLLCCILLLFTAENVIVDAVFMERKWLRKISLDCVSHGKITNTVETCSICPRVSLCGCQVLVCGLEMSTDFTAPPDECRTSVSESIDKSLKLISSAGLGPDRLQQLLKTSCGLVGGEMLWSTHFLLKVRYGFGWRLSNALIIIFHTFFQWVTWDTWSRLSGLWPCNAWLSSHLCDWGHVWFSHSVKLLPTFICDVHWLVIYDFQRPHSVTPGWHLICLHCANALIGAGVKFSLFLLLEIVENFWRYITRILLSDMALQFRADADPGPSWGGLHRRVLTPKLSNKLWEFRPGINIHP